jgi:hypothetical protein
MRTRISGPIVTIAAVVALWSLTPAPVAAQWTPRPAAGVAKKPGNLPDAQARAPRTAGGKPDLSGVWEPEKNRPCPPEGCPDLYVGQQFFDIGWGLKGTLPYQPWAAEIVKVRTAQNGKEDPATRCLPAGIVRSHTFPLLKKIVQLPGLIIILSERNTAFRQIFTDGRPLPVDVDLPSFNGFSSGKWQGDTLVVETTGFNDDVWLDQHGSPLTSEGKITERFRRPSYGQLEIEITVDDKKAYTAPWTVKLNQHIMPDTELLDYICLENEKDVQNLVGK